MMSDSHEDILGPSNPKELDGQSTPLYETEGTVHQVADFAVAHADLLSAHESDLICSCSNWLADLTSHQKVATTCLTASRNLRISNCPALSAQRSGARSAFWSEQSTKFKGCRPVLDGEVFPLESLPFGAEKIVSSQIPFGVMRAEGVMREILAYCFFRSHQLPVHSTPICVYEYDGPAGNIGYCLVYRSVGEERAEGFIDYPNKTVADIIKAQEEETGGDFSTAVGAELNVKGLNLWWYVDQKARLLSSMHFAGGFRGILNSNIGNDVLIRDESGVFSLLICDFDTFRIVDVPENPAQSFVSAFALQCLVEVAKGSLSILQYVHLAKDCSPTERAEALGGVYFRKSSLWRAYERLFLRHAEDRGWHESSVITALQHARRTEAFADILASCVLNSYYVEQMASRRGIFYPHG